MGGVSYERIRIPGLDAQQDQALNRNLERLLSCQPANFRRSCFYDGKQAISQAGSVIPPQYFKLGLALGWSAKAVDALTRRAQFDRFVWPEGDLESLGMMGFARDNFLVSELLQNLSDSALHGVSFLINTQGVDDEPRSLVHAKDALNASGTWNTRRRVLDDALSVTSGDPDNPNKPTGLVLYMPGLTISVEKVDARWKITNKSEHPWGVPVEPVVYRPRTSRRYGSSRLTAPLMGLHSAGVRELIRLEGHMDIYAWPEFWLLGGDMSAFRNADGSQKALWQIMLGRIKGLEDNPDKPDHIARPEVKQFPAASPMPHIEDLDMLSRAFAREASLPDSAVALKGLSNPTSADAYDASQYELIAEAEGAMRDWSTPIIRSVARGLAIRNGRDSVPDEWLTITPDWLGAKFESQAAKADAGAKLISSVPWLDRTTVGLKKLGLSDLEVREALAERRREAGREVIAALSRPAPQPPAEAEGATDADAG